MKDVTYWQQHSVGRSNTIVLLAVRTPRELGGTLPICELVLVITGIVNTALGSTSLPPSGYRTAGGAEEITLLPFPGGGLDHRLRHRHQSY